jgi:hypothetical protein
MPYNTIFPRTPRRDDPYAAMVVWDMLNYLRDQYDKLVASGGGTISGTLPCDTYVPVDTRIIANYIGHGLSYPAWRIYGSGKQEWGDGAGAVDTNLYRAGTDALMTDDQFIALRNITSGESRPAYPAFVANSLAADGYALLVKQAADTQQRFFIARNGEMYWGPGNATQDTNLYRGGANYLQTDDGFIADSVHVQANSAALRISLATDGRIYWGTAYDTNLYRLQANILASDDSLFLVNQAVSTFVLVAYGTGDSQWHFGLQNNGAMSWGPGNAGFDTNLYRSGPNTLTTDGSLTVKRDLVIGGPAAADQGYGIFSRYGDTAGRVVFAVRLAADTADRFLATAAGQLLWGPGNGAGDTNLYRSAPDTLKTDDKFIAANDLSTQQDLYARQGAASQVVMAPVAGSAGMYFGSALDVSLYRDGAGKLITNTTFTPRDFGVGPNIPSNDFNNATSNGWFYGQPGSLNPPGGISDYWAVEVVNITYGGACRQIAYRHASSDVWMRTQNSPGVWASWVQTWPVAASGVPGTLPADTVIAAGTRIISNKTGAADAYPSWRILGDGRQEWGPPAGPLDTAFFRRSPGVLSTDRIFAIDPDNGGLGRIDFGRADGAPDWGSIYRAAATGRLWIRSQNDWVFWSSSGTGKLYFTPDGSALDVNLYRKAAGLLGTDTPFRGSADITANTTSVGAFTANTVAIGHTGGGYGPYITFGVADTFLYRSAATAGVLVTSAPAFTDAAKAGHKFVVTGPYTGNDDHGFGLVATNGPTTYISAGWKLKADASGYYRMAFEYQGTERFGYGDLGNGSGFFLNSGGAGIYFEGTPGVLGDTRLFRNAANSLYTPGNFGAGGTITSAGRMFCNDGIWVDGGSARFIGVNGDGIGFYVGGYWRYFFQATGLFRIDHGNAVITLYDKNISRGSDRVAFSSGIEANGFLYSMNGPVYCGTDLFIGYSAGGGGDTYLTRSSAGVAVFHDTLVCAGYVQGTTRVYGNGGLSAYDSANSVWQTWTGYASGLQSSGHVFTANGGYSCVTSYVCYNRHDSGGVMAGVNDDVKWYRDTGSGYVGWRTEQDVLFGKDMGVIGWIGMYVFVSNIGWRRVQVSNANIAGSGYRALCVLN